MLNVLQRNQFFIPISSKTISFILSAQHIKSKCNSISISIHVQWCETEVIKREMLKSVANTIIDSGNVCKNYRQGLACQKFDEKEEGEIGGGSQEVLKARESKKCGWKKIKKILKNCSCWNFYLLKNCVYPICMCVRERESKHKTA